MVESDTSIELAIPSNESYKRQENNKYALLLFLIHPFSALLYAIRNYKASYARNLVWFFCVFFGFTFVITEGSIADSSRLAMHLREMHRSGMSLNELLATFYTSGSGNIDIVQNLITFIVSRFTADYRFLFAVFGLVFGYFYSRNIWLLIDNTNTRTGIFSGLVLLAFIVVDGIWNINGFRYYLAVQVFLYGCLSYFLEGNKRKLWVAAAASILIHWSFFIAVAVLLMYVFLNNRTRVFFIFFIVSFFIDSLQLDIIRQWFESYAPALIRESRSGYLNEAYIEVVEKSKLTVNWYLQIHGEGLKWFVFVSFAYIYLRGINELKLHKPLYKLFNFSLLFYAIVNVVSIVPSAGRFYAVANMLSLAFIFLNFQMAGDNYSPWLKRIGVPVLLLFIIVSLRIGFDYMSAFLLLGNPITALFIENKIPLIEFVKGLF